MTRPTLGEACTKIVSTVGPACDTVERLVTLIEHGVDIFRINTAHGDRASHAKVLADIREASKIAGYPTGILLDLAGPKLRLGKLFAEPLVCEVGMELTFVRGDVAEAPMS